MTFFSKVKNPRKKNSLTSQQRLAPPLGGGIFYRVGPCFLLQKTRQKAVKKKVKKKSRPKKSWAGSSRKFFQQTNAKFITTPKMGRRFSAAPFLGRAPLGARVVVLNFVSVFCKGLQELLAQLFFGLGFFLTFFLTDF